MPTQPSIPLGVDRSMLELLRPEMRGRQVKTGVWQEPRRRYWSPLSFNGTTQ